MKAQNTIVKKLIIYLIVVSSVITLIATSIQLYRQYEIGVSDIKFDLIQTEISFKESMRSSLWVLDDEQIIQQLEGILRLKDMTRAVITKNNIVMYSSGEEVESNAPSRTVELTYKYNGRIIHLGDLVIFSTLDNVYQKLIDDVLILLISNAIKTFIVSLFMFYVFHKLVTRHLYEILEFTNSISLSSPTFKDFHLDRNVKYNDEIELLVDGVNALQSTVHKTFDDLLRSEEQFRTLVENIPGVTYRCKFNKDLTMKFISTEIERLSGYKANEILSNKPTYGSIIHPEDSQYVEDKVKKAIDKYDSFIVEYRIINKNKEIRWVFEKGQGVYKGNKLKWIDGVIIDITVNKINEEKLTTQEHQLRRTFKMDALGKLTGGIAHDYNNMLGIVLGYTEMLQSSIKDVKQRKYIENILHATKRSIDLTTRLLSFSRDKHSKNEVVDINESIRNEFHIIEKVLTARISFSIDLEENLWLTYTDPGDLEDAIMNIAINSSHAIIDKGTFTISTSNKNVDEIEAIEIGLSAGEYVTVKLKDSGKGMNEETLSNVFDPFYSTKGDKGTGLGLSQVYGFMSRSNGTVIVESEINAGSEFTLYFPRNYSETDAVADTSDDSKLINNNMFSENEKRTVLIVDDEVQLCDLASEFIKDAGYKVYSTNNAKDALDLLSRKKVNLVFSDVVMPELSGFELSIKIKKLYPGIKILLTSGFNDEYTSFSDADKTQQNILSKPYSKNDLLKSIKDCLKS